MTQQLGRRCLIFVLAILLVAAQTHSFQIDPASGRGSESGVQKTSTQSCERPSGICCTANTEECWRCEVRVQDEEEKWRDCVRGLAVEITRAERYKEHKRFVVVDEKSYKVHYRVDTGGMMFVPSTNPPGQLHYSAKITVFMLVEDRGEVALTEPFPGQWTPAGCFEDNPEMLVRKALKVQKK